MKRGLLLLADGFEDTEALTTRDVLIRAGIEITTASITDRLEVESSFGKDPKLPEPYFNIATCYLNQALALEQKNEPRLYRDKLTDFYTKARPQMEQYRQMAPKDQKRWAPALYRIYLNLNLGRQFEEIDRLMRR